ncbi:Ribosomal RNA-processing protein 12 [Sphaceloma murrayae]|uniref:Ribosomal RNA-processing protein 12 n=1 Tax=Sphaceloma murrayae TaxID=2082308 RepID=A0A2K1R016_9PEZI|nr:Ribosomal RNA-processing protein 12 [Sphaceloma murrayae]
MAIEQLRLLSPLYLLALSCFFLPVTIVNLLTSFQLAKLISWSTLQDAWFGRFWAFFGPRVRETAAGHVEPLVQAARGVVLDVGPGSGQWLYLYSPQRNTNITKVYGVEPNLEHHPALRRAIRREGLDGIYEIIGVGAEALRTQGILPASVDTIVTVQVLCSVPKPRLLVKELYSYLKPGGQWIVYEHVRTKFTHEFVSSWQVLVDRVWPICFGGCSITRPTDEYLIAAGPWASIHLRPGVDEHKYDTVPHAMGYLRK